MTEDQDNELEESQEDKGEPIVSQEEVLGDQEDPLEDQEIDEDDDLKAYMAEMEALKSDYSDLEDLDMEELQEMKDAISHVKEGAEESALETDEVSEYLEQKETLMQDFSDMEDLDMEDLKEMKDAIEGVKHDDSETSTEEVEFQPQEISSELEERIKAELMKKKEEELEDIITPEMFLEKIKQKRDRIWYHSLWYIVFEIDDNIASKDLLYDALKEVTSKSAIDPIPYHQFVFGLGYILRLEINNKKVIRYMTGGRFKVNINLDTLKDLLETAGEPISNRPIIEESEKKKMFTDFLNDDFLDI